MQGLGRQSYGSRYVRNVYAKYKVTASADIQSTLLRQASIYELDSCIYHCQAAACIELLWGSLRGQPSIDEATWQSARLDITV